MVAVGNIACRPNTGPCGGHVFTDYDGPTRVGLDTQFGQSQLVCVGHSTRGCHQPLSGECLGLAITFDRQFDAVIALRHRTVGQADLDRDAFGSQRLGQLFSDFWLYSGQKTRAGHQRDLHAQSRRHLRDFATDITTAQYHDALRALGQGQKACGIKRIHGFDPIDCRHMRARAGGDQSARSGNNASAHCDAPFDKLGRTFFDVIHAVIGG